MTQDDDRRLVSFGRRWTMSGNRLICVGCDNRLLASLDGQEAVHKEGCSNAASLHPWAELRTIIWKK